MTITKQTRWLMQQSEQDSPDVKQLKWDFWSLQRMGSDYRDILNEQGIDLSLLQTQLVELVAIANPLP
jgi:hypothetical protein